MIPWFRGMAPPGLVLLRESARQSRRPTVYALRAVLAAIGIMVVLGSTLIAGYSGLDVAQYSKVGRGAFITLVVSVHLITATVVPLLVGLGVLEEREEGTLDLVMLTRIKPLQIVLGKAFSRIGLYGVLVMGLLPIVGLIASYGGISLGEIGMATAATVVIAFQTAVLAGFLALSARSIVLPWLATVLFVIVAWAIVPGMIGGMMTVAGSAQVAYMCPPAPAGCSELERVAFLSPLFAWATTPGTLLVATAANLPFAAVLLLFGLPTFRASANGQETHGLDVLAIRLYRVLAIVVPAIGYGGLAIAWRILLGMLFALWLAYTFFDGDATMNAWFPAEWLRNPPIPSFQVTLVFGLIAWLGSWMFAWRLIMGAGATGPWGFIWANWRRKTTRTRWTGPGWFPVIWRDLGTRAYGAGSWVTWITLAPVALMFTIGLLIAREASYGGTGSGDIGAFIVGMTHPALLVVAWVLGTESGTQEKPEVLEPMLTTTFGVGRFVVEKSFGPTLRAWVPAFLTLGVAIAWMAADPYRCDTVGMYMYDGWQRTATPLWHPENGGWLLVEGTMVAVRLAVSLYAASAVGLAIGLVVRPARLAWGASIGLMIALVMAIVFGLMLASGMVALFDEIVGVPSWMWDAGGWMMIALFAPTAALGQCTAPEHEILLYAPFWIGIFAGIGLAFTAGTAFWMRSYGKWYGPGSAR